MDCERSLDMIKDPSWLERIGQGFCGTVWAAATCTCNSRHNVIKREDGGPGRSLSNEYHIQQRVLKCLEVCDAGEYLPNIPACSGFLDKTDQLWTSILPRLPAGHLPCNALISEKIPPVSTTVRRLLVDNFLRGVDTEKVLGSETNRHCLIRPYLGRRRHRREPTERAGCCLQVFSLRNFPLHVDQMKEIGVDASRYAVAMADALAFLHWSAKIDANDVEFVLAAPRRGQNPGGVIEGVLGPHAVWILDFDCCKEMSMDENGVRQAARCFWRNDPFYPRPGSANATDERIWDAFRDRFLKTSEEILKGKSEEVRQLPRRLVDMIIETRGTFTKG